MSEAKTLTTIPVLPISYGDAQPLLAALEGTGGAGRVARRAAHHVSRRARARQGPPEAEVQLGHQDALQRDRAHSRQHVPGRVDHPRQSSRRLGQRRRRSRLRHGAADGGDARRWATLLKQGWKPKRTIIYCAWDGEEPGLLGSTEWAEAHAAELQRKAAVYINSDANGRGFLQVEARTRWRSSSTAWRATSRTRRPR